MLSILFVNILKKNINKVHTVRITFSFKYSNRRNNVSNDILEKLLL